MYRCFACDVPAQYNCACHTQVEGNTEVDPTPVPQERITAVINIASGEDAMELTLDHT